MNSKAQSSLEYLLTYGWALILITTVISILIFIVSSPSLQVTFSSSNPLKILIKSNLVDDLGNVTVIAQNLTGGKITIMSFYTGGDFFSGKVNGRDSDSISSTNPLELVAGELLLFEEIEYVGLGPVDGTIYIEYTDYAGLLRIATITANGTTTQTAEEITACVDLSTGGSYPGKYALSGNMTVIGSGDDTCFDITGNGVILNGAGKTIVGDGTFSNSKYGVSTDYDDVTIANLNIQDFYTGIGADYSSGLTITNNTITGDSDGISIWVASDGIISNNTITDADGGSGIFLSESSGFQISGNTITDAAGFGTYGIYVEYESTNIVVNNNIVDGSGVASVGIYIDDSSQITVSNNTVTGTVADGIFLSGVDEGIVANNMVNNNPGYGISFSSSGSSTVTNNTICGNSVDMSCSSPSNSGSGNTAGTITDEYLASCGISSSPC